MSALVDLKFWEFLLTDQLRMTSIVLVLGKTYGKQFNGNYLKNKKVFLAFLLYI